ncbi:MULTISPECIES: hypothetical protein [Micromonospora]|uniref:hypothetical protein n=1 Tax=Micromonospora TaxID=1873 RepID=UPI000C87F776|nr:hypothetical protein [Verrucosispora sp. ts21]PMR61130.1 hypothetical protein C1A38_10645 [Verrucosispora sp. ts21]
MVNLSARRPDRSRIAHAFGILALFGAAITLMVLVRDPALSSTRLAEPVPAPEITVVEATPPTGSGGSPPAWDEFDDDRTAALTPDGSAALPDGSAAIPDGSESSASSAHRAGTSHRAGDRHNSDALSRSLFWSGVFGLAISLAGLGLVSTRRRMW